LEIKKGIHMNYGTGNKHCCTKK